MMDEVRIGIIGVGGIGNHHADYLRKGQIKRARLAAVCDIVPEKMAKLPDLERFADSRKMIRSGEVDAVIISTPHYAHTTISIDAFRNGIHVLSEKPIAVHKADAQRMIRAHRRSPKLVFSAMFMMRTADYYKKVKEIVAGGQLGTIQRANWIITTWFRTEAYYASGGWRATWAGEGGGVLANQCPHNLDLWQWVLGLPKRVSAVCSFGKYHDIEVEDEVNAYMEYGNGATAQFVTTTGEAPGTNRWEIVGDKGTLVIEGGKLLLTRNEVSAREFSKTSKESFAAPKTTTEEVPVAKGGGAHWEITQDFVNAILNGTPLIAPGEDGINAVELANAMVYSSLTRKTVELPLDAKAYESKLMKLIKTSRFVKRAAVKPQDDINASFK